MSLRLLAVVPALVLLLSACAGQTAELASLVPSASAAPTSTPVATPDSPAAEVPTSEPTVEPEPVSTPEPVATPEPTPIPDGPALYRIDDVVTVTQGGDPYLDIVVTKVSQKKSYGSGYFVDKPAKGNVYIQAVIAYTALADGATYNPFDWQVFCNDEAVDDFTYVSDGPQPGLSSGTLPKGRKARGWVVYEIPASGRCVLSYGANSFIGQGAVFEVLLRSK